MLTNNLILNRKVREVEKLKKNSLGDAVSKLCHNEKFENFIRDCVDYRQNEG